MSTTTRLSDDADLFTFLRSVAAGNVIEVSRALDSSGNRFALEAIRIGSTRQDPTTYFLSAVRRHVYAGDTGLHIAAAAYGQRLAQLLIDKGSSVRARNRLDTIAPCGSEHRAGRVGDRSRPETAGADRRASAGAWGATDRHRRKREDRDHIGSESLGSRLAYLSTSAAVCSCREVSQSSA